MTNIEIIMSLKCCTEIINKVYSTHVREILGGFCILLFIRLLASSQYASGKSRGSHLDTGLLGFPLCSRKC
jgi:hypothetical protein